MRKRKNTAFITVMIFIIFTFSALSSCGKEEIQTEKTNYRASVVALPAGFTPDSLSGVGDVLTLDGYSDDGAARVRFDTSSGAFLTEDVISGSGKRIAGFDSGDCAFVVESVGDGETSDYLIKKLGKNGEVKREYSASELFGIDISAFGGDLISGEGVFSILFCASGGDYDYIVSNTGAVRADKNGGVILVESEKKLFSARLGEKLIVSDGSDCEVNFDRGELVKTDYEIPRGYVFSLEGYDLATLSGGIVCGYTLSDGEFVGKELFDATYVGIPGSPAAAVSVGDVIYILSFDLQSGENNLWRVEPCEEDERIILTLGVVAHHVDPMTSNAVAEFNRTNGGYRIKIRTYSSSDGRPTSKSEVDAVECGLISGDIPDIILISPEYADLENYASKGVFEPLDGFLTDAERANRLSGDKYTFPLEAEVRTLLGRRGDFPDRMELDAALDKLYSLPDDQALFFNMKFSELLTLSLGEFIDEDGTTNFDSELFRRFAAAFYELGDKYHSEAVVTNDRFASLANGEVLLSRESLLPAVFAKYSLKYGVDDITDVGYPGGDLLTVLFSGGISAKSLHKDAAWEFLRLRVSDKYLFDRYSTYIPIATKSAFSKYVESKPKYMRLEGDSFISSDERPEGRYFDISAIMSEIEESILSARVQSRREKLILNVIVEELSEWKSRGGELDETIKVIDDRVSTIRNE